MLLLSAWAHSSRSCSSARPWLAESHPKFAASDHGIRPQLAEPHIARVDVAIAESEAEYQGNVAEAMADIVKRHGPQVLTPRSDAQKLAAERRELEKRRRAQGW